MHTERLAFLGLILALPFLFQMFQYLGDVPPLWAFSKVLPLVLAPLTVLGLLRLRLPHVGLAMLVLAYVTLVSPALSMLQLQNNLPEALAGSVKVWAFSFYFAAAFLLVALRVTEAALTRALLWLAAISFVLLWLLWLTVPAELYGLKPAGESIFLWDEDRGRRLLLPMAFGLIGMFWLARRFAERPAIWPALLLGLALVSLLMILKYRTVIAATAMLVLWGMSGGFRRRLPALFWGMAIGGGALALAVTPLVTPMLGGTVGASLGGSLTVRQNSTDVLLRFLGEDPWRWLIGVGGSTDFSRISIQDILRTRDFFFADLGWLGLVGEYGVLGSALILLLHLAALRETRRAMRLAPTPLRCALHDFMLYQLITSVVLSLVLTPGQVVTVMALTVYLQRLGLPIRHASPPSWPAATTRIGAPSRWPS